MASEERWIEMQFTFLVTKLFTVFGTFPETIEFIRLLSKLGKNTNLNECDKMMTRALPNMQLPFLKEAIAVVSQNKGNLSALGKLYDRQVPNIYQLRSRMTDLDRDYYPTFDDNDRQQMKYILDGYEKLGGVILQ